MSTKKKSKSKSKSKKEVSIQIYARVRGLMPWEPKDVSLKIVDNTKIQNKARQVTNQYSFSRVFKPTDDNKICFNTIVMPMITNVLIGYNAVLIAYGQTGSGKTYSMLGKPKLGIVGLLPMMLEYIVSQNNVSSVELSAVEAFGFHIAKIKIYDLFDDTNQVMDWAAKKGDTGLDITKATAQNITDAQDAHDKIIYAHKASHFAATGKNPESSRGHVTFVAKITQLVKTSKQISYFVMVDCAGSEGESAFTKEYIKSVSKATLNRRRLEAGCINTGLSQLQIIFNELRLKGKLSNTIGNGLRRILHPYINTQTYLSVLFALSPSVNNARSTEATLKFAVTAGMVKVAPIAAKKFVDMDALIDELRKHITNQEKLIEENNDKAEKLQNQLNTIKLDIVDALEEAERKKELLEKEMKLKKDKDMNDKDKNDFMKEILKQKSQTSKSRLTLIGLDIDQLHINDDDDDTDNKSNDISHILSPFSSRSRSLRKKHRTLTLSNNSVISLDIEEHQRVKSEIPAVIQLQIAALEKQQEDDAAALLQPIFDKYGDKIDPVERVKIAQKKIKGFKGMVTVKQNQKDMKDAVNKLKQNQNGDVSITQFAKTITKSVANINIIDDDDDKDNNDDDNKNDNNTDNKDNISADDNKNDDDDDDDNDNVNSNMRVYSSAQVDEYMRLKNIDYKNLDLDNLREYAEEQWLFYMQEKIVTKQLQQSQNIITDYLQEEMEGLLSYFRVRKILPKQKIKIQW